jgi:hypothetical protein
MVLVAFAPVLAGAAQKGRYANPGGFSLEAPAGWRRDDARGSGTAKPDTARFFGPTANNYTVNLAATSAPVGNATIDALVGGLKQEAAQSKGGFMVTADKRMTVDGAPTAVVHSRRKMPSANITVEQRQLVSLKGGKAAVLTMSFLPSTVKTNDPIWERIVKSFRWK